MRSMNQCACVAWCDAAILGAGHPTIAWSLPNMHRHFDLIYDMTLNHRVGAAQWY
jgi:hypothetical protein